MWLLYPQVFVFGLVPNMDTIKEQNGTDKDFVHSVAIVKGEKKRIFGT